MTMPQVMMSESNASKPALATSLGVILYILCLKFARLVWSVGDATITLEQAALTNYLIIAKETTRVNLFLSLLPRRNLSVKRS
jgi:hypothetical protein